MAVACLDVRWYESLDYGYDAVVCDQHETASGKAG